MNTSSLKIAFYKCIGSLSYIDIFINSNQMIEYLMHFLEGAKDKTNQNIHVTEKISWTVANICSNLQNYSIPN